MSTVCRFIPVAETMDAIQIINFVHEQERIHVEIKINPVCKICYVTGGTASLGFEGKTCTVRKGDVFFLLPAFDYSLHGAENFTYMYISFLGVGATAQMELMNISRKNFLFPDMADLEPFWLAAFSLKSEVIGIASQSVLLFTLAKIGDKKYILQRSKGLGENQPDMMNLTTMNPETRRLVKVMPEEAERTAQMFDMLLGDDLQGRKEFIAENGYLYLDDADIS